MGYIYFIREGNGTYYKIGLTKGKKESRITGLQTGNARQLYLYGYIEYPDNVIADKESEMHYELNIFAIRGEWFSIRTDFLDQFIRKHGGIITENAELMLPPPTKFPIGAKDAGKRLIPIFLMWGLALPFFIYFIFQIAKIATVILE